MKFFFDDNGYPSIKASDDFRILTDFIKDDIQRSIYGVNEFINACELVKSGSLPFWEGTGNSHTVTIRPNCVELFNEYTEEAMIISSIDEFKGYLDKWKALISDENGL
ncbi:hypothetical protein RJ492_004208 [Pluralibacter gergoviae]|uniref:Uncharacterized protein n=1 Tax=Pluralibacter gergoviae TaxID=61647 RepID=A0AAI9DKE0_PLUGE|nr:hypothetical protein [Pluralibacter gergoviae]EKV0916978.1 hypothetical protein [Pluralibacter gergoviae]EKV9910912.1 hypothetical protein [Pluralibacter gergoviae]EKW7277029.1 hypothetical protein [Pluralibacter gergoviae]ELC3076622.1 hypothetical protein [Pluralibacter gergoviae]ELD4297495.1 hypothetical protein [Pluralibacter gergoviae]